MTETPRHDADVDRRLAALTLQQKTRLLTGADFWSLHPEPDVGLRRLVVSDGPAGVRGETWDERDPSANVPSPTALAASWDLDRVERIGGLLAAEARRKGVDVLLAPTVNLHRSPYGGRHFECLSEDPRLTALVGAAFVRGVQAGGVGTTVKHVVANDSETQRMTYDARIDERALREVYLLPFEVVVVDGGAWAVMAAYNGVNGVAMTASPLLRTVLKEEWGFDGVVMSDWFAARSLDAAGPGLLDLVMPGPVGPWGDRLVAAVRDGSVPEAAVDDKVRRVLRLAARVGALDGVETAASTGSAPGSSEGPAPSAARSPRSSVAMELRAAAAAGFVLARNEGPLLPLDPARLRRVAVLGPSAAAARTLGGGSATVFPPYVVSPLTGLRDALEPDVDVVHQAGVRLGDRVPLAPPELLTSPDGGELGVHVRFLDRDGTVLATEERRTSQLFWSGTVADGLPLGRVAAVELHARLRVPTTGTLRVGASGLGTVHLTVDGVLVADAVTSLPPDADPVEGMMRPPQVVADVPLPAGRLADLVLRHEPAALSPAPTADVGMLVLHLNAEPVVDEDEELARAAALAAESDVAVVVVGTTEDVESEGFDRPDLALPGRQDELVRRVAAANPRTVVVVNAGAPVLLPWADDVTAVLLAWFPGQEFGHALADVLLGADEPGGRLPTTWPLDERDLPSVVPVDGVLAYDEGLFVGHRGYERDGRAVRYPFGHGLGYTDWAYESLDVVGEGPGEVAGEAAAGTDVAVTVRVRNTGSRVGREVVQLYASRPGSTVERPLRWLAGFAGVELAPGEAADVAVPLAPRALQHWDGRWVTEPGGFTLHAGRSVADLRLSAPVEVGPTG